MTFALKFQVQWALGAIFFAQIAGDRRYQGTKIRFGQLFYRTSILSLLLLMAKGRAPKSWAEQLADLEDPAPRGWFDCILFARSNFLQSLIQRTMLGYSRRRTGQIQLAMMRTKRKLVDTTRTLGTQSITAANLGLRVDNSQEEQAPNSRWL